MAMTPSNLHADWRAVPRALPVMIVAFSYHNMVPSVFSSLDRKARPARSALLLGSGVSLLMYVIWQFATLGGNRSDSDTHNALDGGAALEPLSEERIFTDLRASAGLALPAFSFLALVTSVLGVGLGCVDFVEDALSTPNPKPLQSSVSHLIAGKRGRRAAATVITFGPSLFCAVAFPGAFLPALEFSGIFRQILFGALPVAMAWRIRRMHKTGVVAIEPDKLGHGGQRTLHKKDSSSADESWGLEVDPDMVPLKPASQVGTFQARHHTELLPGGSAGLGLLAAITALLMAIQLEHIVQSISRAR